MDHLYILGVSANFLGLVKNASARSRQRTTEARWESFWSTMSPTRGRSIVRERGEWTTLKETDANMAHTDIRTWFANVEQHATEGVNKILIGNKCDWEEKRAVSTEQGQALADELGVPFMEVSAKSNINVEKAFFSLANDIKRRIIDTARTEPTTGGGGLNVGAGQDAPKSGCC